MSIPKPTEQSIVNACMDLLALRGALAIRINSGAAKIGDRFVQFYRLNADDMTVVDILGTTRTGRSLACEVKRPGLGKKSLPTAKQQAFLDAVAKRGGLALCVTDVRQLDAALTAAERIAPPQHESTQPTTTVPGVLMDCQKYIAYHDIGENHGVSVYAVIIEDTCDHHLDTFIGLVNEARKTFPWLANHDVECRSEVKSAAIWSKPLIRFDLPDLETGQTPALVEGWLVCPSGELSFGW